MIKEITFEEIKPFWQKYLWPHLDVERVIPYSYFPNCDYVSRVFQEVNPVNLPFVFIGYYNDDDNIVGVLNGYRTSLIYFRSRGLWVHRKYRNKGIATEMMKYIEVFARHVGCTHLWTVPRISAIGFYDSYGFERESDFVLREGKNCFATKKIAM